MRISILAILIELLFSMPIIAQIGNEQPPLLHIHLPRQISLEASDVQLGLICLIRGQTDRVAQAQQIRMGKIYNPSQSLILTRAQILSRLACSGLKDVPVKITGARQIKVSRSSTCIKGMELVGMARRYALQHLPVGTLSSLELMRAPQDLQVGQDDGPFQLVPQQIGKASTSQIRIRIAVMAQGTERAHRDIVFRLKHQQRVLVATETLTEGQTVTAENTRLEQRPSPVPQSPRWRPPYGQLVQRTIDAGTDIQANWLMPVAPTVSLTRNEIVLVRMERPGLLISVMGKVLEKGHTGDNVRIQNIESNQVILCRVQEDGSVTPIM
ncbi:flagellar basal body P-ring formation chaperone FlgA [Planctomycetota bacterium]